jgi:outer membrane protein OmpA-like peptidoglycan-associated protein
MLAMACSALCAGTLASQQQPDRLLPQKKRITDEAYARDRALIQRWQARADSLPVNPDDAYARSRAVSLFAFVGSEYDRANRSWVLDSSFAQAVTITRDIEEGKTWYSVVSEPLGVPDLAPGMWQRLDSLRTADVHGCAQDVIAQAQVKLLLAVEEYRSGGKACSDPVLHEVDELVAEAERRMAACVPPPVDTTPAPAAPAIAPEVPAVPTPERVRVPREVHFGFDRYHLSAATQRVLAQLAAQLKAAPDAVIQLDAYTDPVGRASYNKRLSARRGEAVRNYLIMHGVDPARITVAPLGASAPLREGATLRERYAYDRRVDIRVVPRANIIIEPFDQQTDLQLTPEHRRARSRARPTTRAPK